MNWERQMRIREREREKERGFVGHIRLHVCLENPKEKEDYCRQPWSWSHETMSKEKRTTEDA